MRLSELAAGTKVVTGQREYVKGICLGVNQEVLISENVVVLFVDCPVRCKYVMDSDGDLQLSDLGPGSEVYDSSGELFTVAACYEHGMDGVAMIKGHILRFWCNTRVSGGEWSL